MSVSRNDNDTDLALFRMMRLIRRTEEILMEEYHPADEMRCPIHFCVGQEATPAVLSTLLRPSDVIMSHHRSHGYYLAKGAPLDAMIAEFYGKATGANGGLAGSQELSHDAHNFFSGTILSGMFAMATGAAFAQKYTGTDDVTVGVIGDGGMEEGIVFEALNLAAVLGLPILFVCENNLYSAHTRIDVRSRSLEIVERTRAFQVPSKILDGNDAPGLQRELTEIIAGIRAGNGPFCVEVQTYRTCGHVGPENDDVLGYRTPEELEKWKRRDPLAAFHSVMVERGHDEDTLLAIEAEIDETVHAAIAAAKKAPFPAFEEALASNWSNTFSPLATQLTLGIAAFAGGQTETKLKPY